jgi:hypothetical protein
MGSPQQPTREQYSALQRSGQLEMAGFPVWVVSNGGQIEIKLALARQEVTLVQVSW